MGGVTADQSDKFAEWERKEELKAHRIELFAGNYVWRDLANLKRGWDVVAFHSRFTELARLVGETPDSALYGSRCGAYTTRKCRPQSSIL